MQSQPATCSQSCKLLDSQQVCEIITINQLLQLYKPIHMHIPLRLMVCFISTVLIGGRERVGGEGRERERERVGGEERERERGRWWEGKEYVSLIVGLGRCCSGHVSLL